MRRLSQSATLTLLLSPAGFLIITAARLLIVSDYNSTVALAILSSNGYGSTLLGAIIPMAPIFMPYVALLLLLFNRLLLSLIAFFLALLISPTAITGPSALSLIRRDLHLITGVGGLRIALLIILAIPFVGFALLAIVGAQFKAVIRMFAIVFCMALGPAIYRLYPLPINNSFYADLVRQPWLPADRLTLTSHHSVTGYTLATNGGWFEMLLVSSRMIKFYPESEITNQQICLIEEPAGTKPLIAMVRQDTVLPPCSPPPAVAGKAAHNPVFSLHLPRAATRSAGLPVPYLFPPSPRHSPGG